MVGGGLEVDEGWVNGLWVWRGGKGWLGLAVKACASRARVGGWKIGCILGRRKEKCRRYRVVVVVHKYQHQY